jgi:DNA-directed RNA polymerase specialized sigma subunit
MPIIGDREPDGTREEAVKAMLKEAFRSPERIGQMTSRHTDATGRRLSDRAASHLEVLTWVRTPYLTYRQVRVVELYFRDDLTNEEVGKRLGIHRSTVVEEKRAAVQALIRIIWADPTYISARPPGPLLRRSA